MSERESPAPETALDQSEGLWLSVSDIARRKGISKAALSRRVSRLEGDGLLETRAGPRGAKLVNLAALDRVRNETTDLARAANGIGFRQRQHPNDPAFIYTHEQARRSAYDADLKKLELDEKLGKLLLVEDVAAAVTATGERIVHVLNSLPSRADEIMAFASRGDLPALTQLLRKIVFDIRSAMADEMRAFAHDESD
ncbi:MAG: helix-turn-helix domain-containing protein [Methylovirgula sp.]|jgi:DNA-binding MarR family transcriptional regulator